MLVQLRICTIPLAFCRVSVCVCLVGFASIAIVVVCGRCVTASSAISVAASCSDSHLRRCIMQRLCVAVFMHPCITALFDRHRASLLKTLGVHFIRHPCPFLVKGEVLSPTKIRATAGGDATQSALAPHQPFQNHTIPRHTPPHLAPLPKGAGLRQGYFLS